MVSVITGNELAFVSHIGSLNLGLGKLSAKPEQNVNVQDSL